MRWSHVVAFLLAAVPAAASASVMEKYRSELFLQPDGHAVVHEEAAIATDGPELTRLIPGEARLLEATKDGTPIEARTVPANAGLSFWSFPADAAGTSKYALTYEVRDAVRREDDRMTMRWTIGGGWNAEFSSAATVIFLPDGVDRSDVACLVDGSASESACTIIEAPGQIGIVGTAPGAPLDVRVSWQAPPSSGAAPTLIALAIAAFAYLGTRYGRPRPDVVS